MTPKRFPLAIGLLLVAPLVTAQHHRDYGVDCSFPMHTLQFTQDDNTNGCAAFENSSNGDNNSSGSDNDDTVHLSLLGDRYTIYQDFMEGCRAKFGRRCDHTEDSRVEQMHRQVPSLKNYTDTGFKKLKAPTELFKLIQEHWVRNTQEQLSAGDKESSILRNDDSSLVNMAALDHPAHVEAWTKGHTYVNYWAHNTSYFGLAGDPKKPTLKGGSLDLQEHLFDLAKPILEEWTQMELRPTSLYGIRVYREGAILSPHVDRNPLIASAIINVAQDPDMTEDWPLEVIDREGKAVNVSMVPGDMVLYESGTLIHGRPFALQGKYYANVFVHFEPTGRRLEDVEDDDMLYGSPQNPAGVQEGIRLPPYIVQDSPEAWNFIEYSPYGWELQEEEYSGSESDDEGEEDSEDYAVNSDEEGEEDEDEDESRGEYEYYDEEGEYEHDEYYDEEEEVYENSEDYDASEDKEYETSHNKHSPSCPSQYLDDPSQAPAECRKQMPLHKKIFFQLNQVRRRFLSKEDRR